MRGDEMDYLFTVHTLAWRDGEMLLREVREAVFMREQGVSAELEWDGLDEACRHVLAINKKGQAVACGRITAQGKIGRMAVLPEWRSKQVGSAVLGALLNVARSRELVRVELAAQTQVAGFYERHGFKKVGEIFMDAGMPHIMMQCTISPANTAET